MPHELDHSEHARKCLSFSTFLLGCIQSSGDVLDYDRLLEKATILGNERKIGRKIGLDTRKLNTPGQTHFLTEPLLPEKNGRVASRYFVGAYDC